MSHAYLCALVSTCAQLRALTVEVMIQCDRSAAQLAQRGLWVGIDDPCLKLHVTARGPRHWRCNCCALPAEAVLSVDPRQNLNAYPAELLIANQLSDEQNRTARE